MPIRRTLADALASGIGAAIMLLLILAGITALAVIFGAQL
jgi:hypothetical protein